jgi:hypothetical protein
MVMIFRLSSAALAPIVNCQGCVTKPSALSALHNPSGPWGSRVVPSKTARESAYSVEWEPMSELERRIEDGVNFEYVSTANHRQQAHEEDIPCARGVFVGYRFTEEEYKRLKSADPFH